MARADDGTRPNDNDGDDEERLIRAESRVHPRWRGERGTRRLRRRRENWIRPEPMTAKLSNNAARTVIIYEATRKRFLPRLSVLWFIKEIRRFSNTYFLTRKNGNLSNSQRVSSSGDLHKEMKKRFNHWPFFFFPFFR